MNRDEIRLFQLGLEVLVMLNSRPGKKWAYMETDREWWTVRLWLRKDHTVPPEWPFWRWESGSFVPGQFAWN